MGVSVFPEKKRYEGVRFNVIESFYSNVKLPSQARHQVSMTLTTATPIYVMPLHYTEQMPNNYAQQIAGLRPTTTINYAKMSLP